MKGFFTLELLLISFLTSYLIYLSTSTKPFLPRETESYTQDFAQLLMYGINVDNIPKGSYMLWFDEKVYNGCDYEFRYCTKRYFQGGEHIICAAECLL